MIYTLKTILKESVPGLILATAIALGAGLILSINKEFISIIPGILIIIPSFNQMNGAISSVLSCRLSSALHLGLIRPKLHKTKTLTRNIISTYVIALVSFSVFGVIAWLFNTSLSISTLTIVVFPVIVLLAGLITTIVLSILSILFSYLSYSRGIDPDNWVIPLLTSMGDFMGIFLLFMIAGFAI
jgi:mgtE-like transporter